MSTEDAAARPKNPAGLDIDFHESTHSRIMRKAMSTRNFATNRHDDLLRSGSTHQLLNRPHAKDQAPSSLKLDFPGPPSAPAAPPGAPQPLKTAEETADESDSEGSEFSGGSFCDAPDDCAADREYLEKDLGASLHDEELELDAVPEDKEADDLIASVKNRMKLEEEAKAGES